MPRIVEYVFSMAKFIGVATDRNVFVCAVEA